MGLPRPWKEFAVRGALGASGRRIAGALVSESLLLGLCGGALGVLVAQAGLGLLRRMAPVELPRMSEIGIDGVVPTPLLPGTSRRWEMRSWRGAR